MVKKRICGNKLINIILFFGIILLLLWNKSDFEQNNVEEIENKNQKKIEKEIQKDPVEKVVKTLVDTKVLAHGPTDKKNKAENNIFEQKNLTLNRLAAGFHVYADNKIAAKTNMHDQSITEQRFLEKIVSCIQTLFFINKQKLIPHITTEKTVDILLELKRNGFLNGIIVSKTSGDQVFDNFMKNIIEEGAKSFPPIPQLINKIPYYFVIRISCEYGISLQLLVPR